MMMIMIMIMHILFKHENYFICCLWLSAKWSRAQSCLTLCDPMDCSPPGSSVHGILQARVPEWGTIAFSRRSSRPRDGTWVSRIVGRCFTVWVTREVCLWLTHSKIIKWKYHNNKLMLEKGENKKKWSTYIYSCMYLSTRQIWSKYSKKVTYLNLGSRGICSFVISFSLFLIYLKYFIKNSLKRTETRYLKTWAATHCGYGTVNVLCFLNRDFYIFQIFYRKNIFLL